MLMDPPDELVLTVKGTMLTLPAGTSSAESWKA